MRSQRGSDVRQRSSRSGDALRVDRVRIDFGPYTVLGPIQSEVISLMRSRNSCLALNVPLAARPPAEALALLLLRTLVRRLRNQGAPESRTHAPRTPYGR